MRNDVLRRKNEARRKAKSYRETLTARIICPRIMMLTPIRMSHMLKGEFMSQSTIFWDSECPVLRSSIPMIFRPVDSGSACQEPRIVQRYN